MTDSRRGPNHPPDIIERMAKAMSNPLRVRILMELNNRGLLSPSEFIRECGQPDDTPAKVWRQFQQLESYELIEEVETKSGGRRRGGIEHFYRALLVTEFDTPSWAVLPDQFKTMATAAIFHAFGERVWQAVEAGTINARGERHLTWVTVPFDEAGWQEVIRRADDLYHYMREESRRAVKRMEESGEKPVPATVGLFVFESPPESLPKDLDSLSD